MIFLYTVIASLFNLYQDPVLESIYDEAVKKGIPNTFLKKTFEQQKITVHNKIPDLFARPYEKKSWGQYKKIFVTKKRIDGGLKFFKKNEDRLNSLTKRDGIQVDPFIVLSIIGIETNKLNSQISHLVKNINKDLNIELRKINLVLDPFNFVLNAKTVGPKLKIKEKELDIQNIQTTISINSFLKNKFSLSNLQISTNSLKIENVIAFLRKYKNNPEFFILEKVIKKGYLISNINLEL